MRTALASITTVFLLAAASAVASPRADAEFLAGILMRLGLEDMVRTTARSSYAAQLTRALAEKSVRVTDNEALAKALPLSLIAPHVSDLETHAVRTILRLQNPASIARLAQQVRGREHFIFQDRNARPISDNGALSSAERNVQFKNEIGNAFADLSDVAPIVVLATSVSLSIHDEIRQKPLDMSAPYLSELYRSRGILAFPNPIYRRDLIRNLRSSEEGGG